MPHRILCRFQIGSKDSQQQLNYFPSTWGMQQSKGTLLRDHSLTGTS